MKYRFSPIIVGMALLVLLYSKDAAACDVCGSSSSFSGVGMLIKYNNLVTGKWQMTRFTSNNDHSPGIEDSFQEIEFYFRHQVYNRFSLEYYQPYRFNQREIDRDIQQLSGIADPKLLVNYRWINNRKINDKLSLLAESSAGVRFPVGKYNARIHNTGLPENFNLSNGSFGYLFNTSIALGWKNGGVISSIHYTQNGLTSTNYQFGSSFSNNNIVYYEVDISKKIKLIPSVGFLLEQIDKDQYANERKVPGTGGNGKFLLGSLNIKINKWLIGTTYVMPVSESYSDGEVNAKGKISAQCSFIF